MIVGRIKLLFTTELTIKYPLFKTSINVSLEDTDVEKRRRKRRKKKNAVESSSNDNEEKSETATELADEAPKPQPVLMVEVENVVHEKFKQTDEVKVNIFLFLEGRGKMWLLGGSIMG